TALRPAGVTGGTTSSLAAQIFPFQGCCTVPLERWVVQRAQQLPLRERRTGEMVTAGVAEAAAGLGHPCLARDSATGCQSKCSSSGLMPGSRPMPGVRLVQALVCQLSTGGFSVTTTGSANRK